MPVTARAAALTVLALIAFAFNSVLTRLALAAHQIDAASFTAIRLGSGAIVLVLLVVTRERSWTSLRPQRSIAPLALFAYAAPFSFAYLRIGAAVGALVLFAVVQMTMIGYGVLRGERPPLLAWIGALVAAGGLLNLTLPAVARPDLFGVLLMCVAGVAWGAYSLIGRTAGEPIAANARNFLWSSLVAIALLATSHASLFARPRGIVLAIVSGAVTSGIGYAIWYRAVRSLTAMQAAVAQLTVPIIAGAAAALLLHEQLTTRLIVSGAAVLAGVMLVLLARATAKPASKIA
ncbi:MAG TPA: DMT family transporter [Thermoanaerobaculia bacterium]|nr:DMT family transporter [Thermoanaerobaculia bacterium]